MLIGTAAVPVTRSSLGLSLQSSGALAVESVPHYPSAYGHSTSYPDKA